MLFRASQTNADVQNNFSCVLLNLYYGKQYWATTHSSAFKPIGAKSLRFVYPNSSTPWASFIDESVFNFA